MFVTKHVFFGFWLMNGFKGKIKTSEKLAEALIEPMIITAAHIPVNKLW